MPSGPAALPVLILANACSSSYIVNSMLIPSVMMKPDLIPYPIIANPVFFILIAAFIFLFFKHTGDFTRFWFGSEISNKLISSFTAICSARSWASALLPTFIWRIFRFWWGLSWSSAFALFFCSFSVFFCGSYLGLDCPCLPHLSSHPIYGTTHGTCKVFAVTQYTFRFVITLVASVYFLSTFST